MLRLSLELMQSINLAFIFIFILTLLNLFILEYIKYLKRIYGYIFFLNFILIAIIYYLDRNLLYLPLFINIFLSFKIIISYKK